MESGWQVGGNKAQGIVLERNGFKLCFDIRIETARGVLCAACIKRKVPEPMATAVVMSPKMNITLAHGRLGHMSEESTRKAAKALGWKIIPGSLAPCEDCEIGKGRRKNLLKDTGGPVATLEASRAYLD
jgi:hypothetical protein